MIPWKKYDSFNTPEKGKVYIVWSLDRSFYSTDLPWIATHNGDYWESDWDHEPISHVTHFAEITSPYLPGEETE